MAIGPVLSFRAEYSSGMTKMLCEDNEEESRDLTLSSLSPIVAGSFQSSII